MEAVLASVGPLLVLAGAGTGKTRVVISRIFHLVRQGTPPERILAVTFTNKAAREMVLRIGRKFDTKRKPQRDEKKDTQPQKPEISTIHSLCVRILRRHAERAGYPKRFVIVNRGEQETTARRVLKELKVAEATLRPADLLDRISRWKSRGVRPNGVFDTLSVDADDSWDLAAAGYQRYQRLMQGVGAVDFDDLLLLVDQLFEQDDVIRQQEATRFDHILVDEYQDTSGIQERILSALARDHRSLCVVGDDDQSIYAWRGAQISHILDFPTRWPGATVVRLEENYRSTPEIIEAANQLIECNSRRHGKTLVSKVPSGLKPSIMQAQDEVDEARRVTADVANLLMERYAPPNEMAILVRTGEQTRVFETELRHQNIPYELIGSRSFFDRREVKDVLSFLRLLVDQSDDLALARIANVPPRGLSYNAIEKARRKASEAGKTIWLTLLELKQSGELSPAASTGVEKLEKLISLGPANTTSGLPAADALQRALDQAQYRQYLEKEFEDEKEQESRWQSVEEIVNGLARYEKEHGSAEPATTVQRYLDDLILEVTEAERFEEDKPCLLYTSPSPRDVEESRMPSSA